MHVLKPISKASLYEEAARQLQSAIEAGQWPPGTRMPSERELAQMLGIGRSSLREAMRVLEAMDLVEIRPGEGTFVRPERHPITDPSVRALLQDERVADAYEVRELLDMQIVTLAVELGVRRFRSNVGGYELTARSVQRGLSASWLF